MAGPRDRLEQIKQSHALLRQFTSKELKTLLNLKRNTSPKAWSLREDLVVLTLPASNREIAELLTDRNKEAVKRGCNCLDQRACPRDSPSLQRPNLNVCPKAAWEELPQGLSRAGREKVVDIRPGRRLLSKCRDVAQPGRALHSGCRGRWFKSSRPDH